MDPMALGKGAEVLGEELGVFGKKVIPVQTTTTTTAITDSFVEVSTSNSSDFASLTTSDQKVVEEICNNKEQALSEEQQVISLKKREVEEIFERARITKRISVWKEAKAASMEASSYWNGIIKDIKLGKNFLALSEEEAIVQRDYFIEKEGVAEVKMYEARICSDGWSMLDDQAYDVMALVRHKVWPTVVQAMKAFIKNPSEKRMSDVREAASAYAPVSVSALSVASASALSFANNVISGYAYASASASLLALASAHASIITSSDAYTSAHRANLAFALASSSGSAYGAAYACASAAAYASALVSTYTYVSAPEAVEVANVADDVVDAIKVFADKAKGSLPKNKLDNIEWSVSVVCETADFARAVARYKEVGCREQFAENSKEALRSEDENWKLGGRGRELAATARDFFNVARELKSESSWCAAGAAAQEAASYFRNVIENKSAQGVNCQKAIVRKDFWTERANLAEIKALETSPCDDTLTAKRERANALMKMTHEKFGSPISQAMKEFMAHPNEITLRATGKPFLIAMSVAEAEVAVETAEIFAKASTEAAVLGRKCKIDADTQESADWSKVVAREVLEFARAVAFFKAAKQP
ncbi:MAG: hypothetical protein A3F67_06940 [Verrucomicrobia bacterium RIFCSPHIGHO2_12_FULL_41_10]|nr:MAG: hypothetical protein A3F67_06940 [Verrucomicrobia bacterium RIFCSPHIGHO2_12_FULL_41_10]